MILPIALVMALQEPAAGDGLAFVALSTERRAVLVEEPVEVILRFGFDLDLFETRLVQPFRQHLDVPARAEVAGWGEWESTTPHDSSRHERGSERFVLNDERALAHRLGDALHDGHRMAVFEVRTSVLPTTEGELVLPAPELFFVTTSGFEEDFLGELQPLDRAERRVTGEPLTLDVRPWPVEERPRSFSGAVGRLTLRAGEQAPGKVAVGDTLRLEYFIEGEGNTDSLTPPDPDPAPGLHELGRLVERSPGQVHVTIEFSVVEPSASKLPGLEFTHLVPGPAPAFSTLRIPPTPLELVGTSGEGSSYPAPARPAPMTGGESEGAARGVEGEAGSPTVDALFLLLLLLGPIGFWLGIMAGRRRPGPDGAPPGQQALGRPAPCRSAPVEQPMGAAPDQVLAAELGRQLAIPPAAAYDVGLVERMVAAGASEDLARRTFDLLGRGTEARYGGEAPSVTPEEVSALVAELGRVPSRSG